MSERNLFTTASDARAFMAAGKATVTLQSKATGVRFTYKIGVSEDGQIHFVSLLRGADNETAFSYFGYIRRGVFFHGAAKAKVAHDAPSVKAFSWAWRALQLDVLPAALEIWHEGRCGRCNRKLTVPTSIANGIGPECATRELGMSARFMAEAV
jgi:hypothetical protein